MNSTLGRDSRLSNHSREPISDDLMTFKKVRLRQQIFLILVLILVLVLVMGRLLYLHQVLCRPSVG